MTHFLVLVLVFIGVALNFMTPSERTRILQRIMAALQTVRETVTLETIQSDPFFEALRARTPRVVATPAFIVLSAIIFLFVGSPFLDLFISAVCLLQIGLILERLVGRVAFTTVYIASGIAAGIVSLSVSPGGINLDASGPVLGMYALLLVTSTWNVIHESSLAIPLHVAKRLAPVAAVFVLYRLATTGLANVGALGAIACGLVGGIIIARDVDAGTLQIRRLATAMATVVTVVTLYAAIALQRPLNLAMDIRPEIDRVIAVEAHTARLYEQEVERFRKGRITSAALAGVIDNKIVPELRVVTVRLRALKDVPPEHQRLVSEADAFLKMRDESWKMRAAALRKSDLLALRKADSKEQASREAFHRLTMPSVPDSSTQPSS